MRRLIVITIVTILTSGFCWAIETKSGDISKDEADATIGKKENSEIGVDGIEKVYCTFENMGPPGFDMLTYHGCYSGQLEGQSPPTGYAVEHGIGGTLMRVGRDTDNDGEIDLEVTGLCYSERDRDLEWIELSFQPPVPGRVAKIKKPARASGVDPEGNPSSLFIEINGIKLVDEPQLTGQFDATTALINALPSYPEFSAIALGQYVLIYATSPTETIFQVGFGSTDSNLWFNTISLEPDDGDSTVSYCDTAL